MVAREVVGRGTAERGAAGKGGRTEVVLEARTEGCVVEMAALMGARWEGRQEARGEGVAREAVAATALAAVAMGAGPVAAAAGGRDASPGGEAGIQVADTKEGAVEEAEEKVAARAEERGAAERGGGGTEGRTEALLEARTEGCVVEMAALMGAHWEGRQEACSDWERADDRGAAVVAAAGSEAAEGMVQADMALAAVARVQAGMGLEGGALVRVLAVAATV